ncbi:riboflavin kinase [Arthrobacter sp. B0490]|uniref:riboflavin kinase n=1 Tax=Arthrobacter sp. B0490 TaxID=2058891 RepID=UPI000CE571FF|nr:riboflavin kinase [Arthrobacter sp. B0490]
MQTPRKNSSLVAPSQLHVVDGVVTHGDRRGRLLGFPTANVAAELVGLDDGVWAGTVQVEPDSNGPCYVAAISLGRRPTYYAKDGIRLIEAFLLDFNEQIYDKHVRIEFSKRLRGQQEFSDSSQLVRQLHEDVSNVRTWGLQQGLLPTDATRAIKQRRGWGPTERKRLRNREEDFALRDEQRSQLVSQAVLACPPGALNYQWVASWTGLPLGYLEHRYPSLDALRSAAPGRPHRS